MTMIEPNDETHAATAMVCDPAAHARPNRMPLTACCTSLAASVDLPRHSREAGRRETKGRRGWAQKQRDLVNFYVFIFFVFSSASSSSSSVSLLGRPLSGVCVVCCCDGHTASCPSIPTHVLTLTCFPRPCFFFFILFFLFFFFFFCIVADITT